MNDTSLDTATLARAYVERLDAREWEAWTALLDPEVVYEIPQSRERVQGIRAFLDFNQGYPGEWHLTPKVVIGDDQRAVLWMLATTEEGTADAHAFLEFSSGGLITRVTDFWPEPYEPPDRAVDTVERW